MMLVESKWDIGLSTVTYGDGYDIRVHAVQTALNLIDRRSVVTGSKMGDINFSSVEFGFFNVDTENAIKEFQVAVGIPMSGKLEKVTYEMIFSILRKELNVVIIETKDHKIKIYEVTKEIEDLLPEHDNGVDDDNEGVGSEDDSTEPDMDFWYPNGGDWYTNNPFEEVSGLFPYFSDSFWDYIKDNFDDVFGIYTGKPTFGNGGSSWNGNYNNNGGPTDSWVGNINLGDPSNGHNSPTYGDENGAGVTFVDGLLSNSIYHGNFDFERPISWVSNSKMDINVDGYNYEMSEKHKTFFDSNNTSSTRKSNYDITIVYGPNGRFAKKILGVVPRSRSQQVDSSGEAIFDIIDFIAKDVVETDNKRK